MRSRTSTTDAAARPRAAALAPALAAALALAPAPARAATVEPRTIATADGERHYLLVRPDAAIAAPRPLVLLFHGHGGSARRALGLTGAPAPLSLWLGIADRETLLVAALDGAVGPDGRQGWNDCRAGREWTPTTDDVGFTRAVVERLAREAHADTTRLYAMGMSNGGFFVYRLATELKPPIAAFAAVSASMAESSTCAPIHRPVSALVISGTDDPLVPYAGGRVAADRGEQGGGRTIGIEQAIAAWCRADGITGAPASEEVPHAHGGGDPTRAVRVVYPPAANGARVELVRIEHGGHAEPSIGQRYLRRLGGPLGLQNHDLEAAEEAWRFFREAPLIR